MKDLFVEKYRPTDLDSYLFQDEHVERTIRKWLSTRDIPNVMFSGSPGTGKCLGKGTPVMMFDGSIRPVEDVRVGDAVMGPDSTPRTVLTACSGTEMLYEVQPIKGMSYVVNESHVLSLRESGKDDITNMSVKEYNSLPEWKRVRMKGWRTPISFKQENMDDSMIPPYILGVWLGDGTSIRPRISSVDEEVLLEWRKYADKMGLRLTEYEKNGCVTSDIVGDRTSTKHAFHRMLESCGVLGNKHIPFEYKTASDEDRINLLAGIIDTDGYLCYSNTYDIVVKQEELANDITFVARSLGFAAYVSKCTKTIKSSGFSGIYYRMCISGDISRIPCKVKRRVAPARHSNAKNVLNVGIDVAPIGEGEYYGFSVDKDHLFVLGDFTVTHNSSMAKIIINELDIDPSDVKFVDGSIDNGVGFVRETLEPWLRRASFSEYKIVQFEECDRLSQAAQDALRNVMEAHTHVRWLMTCNHPNKIAPALHSRLQHLQLNALNEEGIIGHIADIMEMEELDVYNDENDVFSHIDAYSPDMRKILNSINEHTDEQGRIHPLTNASLGEDIDEWQAMWSSEGDLDVEAAMVKVNLIDQTNFESFYRIMYENHHKFPDTAKGIVLTSTYLDRAYGSANQALHLHAFLYECFVLGD